MSGKIIACKIIRDDTLSINVDVVRLIEDGWQPLGPASANGCGVCATLTMVKYEPEKMVVPLPVDDASPQLLSDLAQAMTSHLRMHADDINQRGENREYLRISRDKLIDYLRKVSRYSQSTIDAMRMKPDHDLTAKETEERLVASERASAYLKMISGICLSVGIQEEEIS